MNERIRELWDKAAKSVAAYPSGRNNSWENEVKFIEKFAKLIVKECAGVAEITMPPNSHPNDVLMIKNAVLEHFGVEE